MRPLCCMCGHSAACAATLLHVLPLCCMCCYSSDCCVCCQSVSLEELVEIPLTRDLLERPLVKVQPPLACVTLRVEHEPPMLVPSPLPFLSLFALHTGCLCWDTLLAVPRCTSKLMCEVPMLSLSVLMQLSLSHLVPPQLIN